MKSSVNIIALLTTLLVCGIMLLTAAHRLAVDLNTTALSPARETAGIPAGSIPAASPGMGPVAIGIASQQPDPSGLLTVSTAIERRLGRSGLFDPVANPSLKQGLEELESEVIGNLPVLFTAGQLQTKVAPLLTAEQVRRSLDEIKDDPHGESGAIQKRQAIADPLGLRHLVLARLTGPNPTPGVDAVHQRIWSTDRRHLTLLTRPSATIAGTDELARFMKRLQTEIGEQFGSGFTLTHSGPSRIGAPQTDTPATPIARAGLWSVLAVIAGLLVVCSRPAMGLLALLPAAAGISVALFFFSWIHLQISGLVAWFGGVVMAVAAGHGVWFLLLGANQPEPKSRRIAREIWIVGLPPALAATGAFAVPAMRGPEGIDQLGLVGVISIAVSFGFTVVAMPRILPADRIPGPPIRQYLSGLAGRALSTGRIGMSIALLMTIALSGFIRLPAAVDGAALNHLSHRTIYLLSQAPNLTQLQSSNDRLLEYLDTETHAGSIATTVTPSLFFPGEIRRAGNHAAWRRFWTDDRVAAVLQMIEQAGTGLGIADSAQDSFLKMVVADRPEKHAIPEGVMSLMDIYRDESGDGWRQTVRVTPTERFDGQRFLRRMRAIGVDVVPAADDPETMSLRNETATTWVLTVAGLGVLMVLFLADAGLLVIGLLPLVLAAICTLGTLGLMGHFPDWRAWLLALPALGLSTALPLFIIRAWQRYQHMDHPDFKATFAAAVLGAGLVMAGFGILTGTGREPVRTAGWISFLVSAYGLAGTLLILPALLKRRVEASKTAAGSIFGRYSNMTPRPRLAIRCRQRQDPVLNELATLVPQQTDMANILDVGCGYGLPACWLAERYPTATVHGIDPNAERVRVAAMALNERGRVVECAAPDLPPMDVLVDMAILIDTSHCLQDWELEKTLVRIHERLLPGGRLVLRAMLPAAATSRWSSCRKRFTRSGQAHNAAYRNAYELDAILSACGFEILTCRTSGRKGERMWYVARPK